MLKRLAFSLIAMIVTLSLVEGAGRLYGVLRHGNRTALAHGKSFFQQIRQGTLQYQDPYPFAAVREQENVTEWMFQNRHADDPDVRLTEGEAGDVVSAGIVEHLNRFALRGSEFPLRRRPDVTRIAVFGGSFVLGWGLPDAETWPRLLDAQANAGGGGYEVLNAGVNGANIHKVLSLLIRFVNSAGLDAVVVASSYNDHALLRMERRYPGAAKIDFYLYNLSYFYVMLRESLNRLNHQSLEYNLYHQRVHVDARDLDEWLQAYHHRLDQIATVCGEHHLPLLLVAEPERFFDRTVDGWNLLDEQRLMVIGLRIRAGQDVWRAELDYYLQGSLDVALKHFAADHGALFFDGANTLPATKPELLIDQIHPTVDGSRRLAGQLAPVVRRGIPSGGGRRDNLPAEHVGADSRPLGLHQVVASSGADSPLASFARNMQAINATVRNLQRDIEANKLETAIAAADASRLKALFNSAESFWAGKAGAGAALAAAATRAAADAEVAAHTADSVGLSRAVRQIGGLCKTCHDVHRDRRADGTSAVR